MKKENIRKKRGHRKEIWMGYREGEKHWDDVDGRDVPPTGERASHILWWCEKVPAKQGCRAAGMGHLTGGGMLTGHGSWWVGLGHECDLLGNREVNGRKPLSPTSVWKRRWEYRKSELHTSHSSMLMKLDQIWGPGTENQEPADKSLVVLPPWQPLNESLNLHMYFLVYYPSKAYAAECTHWIILWIR